MSVEADVHIERKFALLPRQERETIIRQGTQMHLTVLRKRLFLAESKVRYFEEKYGDTLHVWDTQGLPENADYEVHEDYVLWHHWSDTSQKMQQEIASLSGIVELGQSVEPVYAGH